MKSFNYKIITNRCNCLAISELYYIDCREYAVTDYIGFSNHKYQL